MSTVPTIIPILVSTRATLINGQLKFEICCAQCYKWVSSNKAVHLSKLMTPKNFKDPRLFCPECGQEHVDEMEMRELTNKMWDDAHKD